MQRVTRHNFDIIWQEFLESLDLWVLAGSLPSDHGKLFGSCRARLSMRYRSLKTESPHTWTILLHHLLNRGRLHVVKYVITCPRHKVTVAKYLYIGLDLFLSTELTLDFLRVKCTPAGR